MRTNKIKLTSKDVFRAQMNAPQELSSHTLMSIFEKYQIGTIDGVRVLHYPDLVHSAGTVIALCRNLKMAGCIPSELFIVVDDAFMDMPRSIQKWFIYHELGHIHNHHLDPVAGNSYFKLVVRAILATFGHTTSMELEADEYAAKHTSVQLSLRALTYIQKHCASRAARLESATRKRHLRSLSK